MSARPGRRGSTTARAATVVGVLGLAAGAATTLARSLPGLPGVAPDTWVMVTSFSDLGVLPYGVGLLGLGAASLLRPRAARLVLLAVTVGLTGVHLSWIVPNFVTDGDRAAGPGSVVVLGQNMLLGTADPTSLLANAQAADVLVLTELTTRAASALEADGVDGRFPYQGGGTLPRYGSTGSRVYSRFPVLASRPLDASAGDDWVVDLDVPQLGRVTVVACHPTRPRRGEDVWAPDQERIRRLAPRQRTVLVGDFNAVDSHPSLRALGREGFRDADGVVGAGWTPTYPAQSRIPPLVGIDHVLVSADLTATTYRRVRTVGSDHLGVLATVTSRA